MRSYLTYAAAIFLAQIPGAGTAQEAGQLPNTHVKYGDLDLSTKEGANALHQRIRQAARSVCARPIANWMDRVSERNCVSRALNDAKPQVELALRNAGQAYAMADKQGDISVR